MGAPLLQLLEEMLFRNCISAFPQLIVEVNTEEVLELHFHCVQM
jgi:hypothetical protein